MTLTLMFLLLIKNEGCIDIDWVTALQIHHTVAAFPSIIICMCEVGTVTAPSVNAILLPACRKKARSQPFLPSTVSRTSAPPVAAKGNDTLTSRERSDQKRNNWNLSQSNFRGVFSLFSNRFSADVWAVEMRPDPVLLSSFCGEIVKTVNQKWNLSRWKQVFFSLNAVLFWSYEPVFKAEWYEFLDACRASHDCSPFSLFIDGGVCQ